MKQSFFLLTIILLLIQSNVWTQQYLPLPDSNAAWVVEESANMETFFHKYTYDDENKDTLINRENYQKVYLTYDDVNYIYSGAIRNTSNGIIHYVPPFDSVERLMYDFTKESGDTIFNASFCYWEDYIGSFDMVVDTVVYIQSGPYTLKALLLSCIEPYPPYYNGNGMAWVEGIGSLNGGLLHTHYCGLNLINLKCMNANDTIWYSPAFNSGCFFSYSSIELTYESGTCDLPVGMEENLSTADLAIYPNPVKDFIKISNIPKVDFIIRIVNPLGETVFNESYADDGQDQIMINCSLEPGLYIIRIESQENKLLTKKIIVN
ncbi:MAG: T9SS type A sorting domain-containing protein [Bacteroidales bacterium]|nr:T9SS type A sorting domain-containing protein [Bacteroidales bacterium]